MSTKWVKPLFIVAAVYDLILGAVAIVASPQIYRALGVTPPTDGGLLFTTTTAFGRT